MASSSSLATTRTSHDDPWPGEDSVNPIHRVYCRSHRWRSRLEDLLPWATDGVALSGAAVLELGSGPGLTTDWLRSRTGSLVAVEQNKSDAESLRRRAPDVEVYHADATALPFRASTFDTVLCFTMLHHVPSTELQDRLFAEAARVLRPGGTFAGSDSTWSPLLALAHMGDSFQLVDPKHIEARLHSAGFMTVNTETRRGSFRFVARTPSVSGPPSEHHRA